MPRLPTCPKCGNKETVPTKVYNVIVEPTDKERGLTQRKVGMYTCSKCGTKFPTVVSRQKYLIVAEDHLGEIEKKIRQLTEENEALRKQIETLTTNQQRLQEKLQKTKEENQLIALHARLSELESFVEHLRKEKEELEQKVRRLG